MEPFASDSAEANVLRSGGLTYGYVPFEDLPAVKTFEKPAATRFTPGRRCPSATS